MYFYTLVNRKGKRSFLFEPFIELGKEIRFHDHLTEENCGIIDQSYPDWNIVMEPSS
ncbi:7-cyano-7-deazaguanine reductase [Anopheles sinensis]|uniref:7-cyano-7-deazaguanine reductase n=1 Tax=Anopheles sinensis TaxID=74873 RepID=A0A084WUE2_ANOSI|nr:7-cyano-7-deazaguanine reductase [Anopheles sinensis]